MATSIVQAYRCVAIPLKLPANCRLVVVLDQRVNVYALETLEKLCTLETASNPKVHPTLI